MRCARLVAVALVAIGASPGIAQNIPPRVILLFEQPQTVLPYGGSPSAANDQGVVAISKRLPGVAQSGPEIGAPHRQALVWDNGAVAELPDLAPKAAWLWSWASDINNSGVIVGSSTTAASDIRAVRWAKSEGVWAIKDLGVLDAHEDSWRAHSEAHAVNDAGIIAGHSWTGTTSFYSEDLSRAMLWTENEQVVELPKPGDAWGTRALGLNNSGVIVGDGKYLPTCPNTRRLGGRALVWRNGGVEELPVPDGWLGSSVAYYVNDRGDIVGSVSGCGGIPLRHCVVERRPGHRSRGWMAARAHGAW